MASELATDRRLIHVDAIPLEMRQKARWVLWRYERRKAAGKPTKVPYSPNGEHASSRNFSTWASFEEALFAYQNVHPRSPYSGIGYVLDEDEVGIDMDNVRNPQSGELLPAAADYLTPEKGVWTYAEISPSGGGIKCIGKAKLPANSLSVAKGFFGPGTALEIHAGSKGRYYAITGDTLGACNRLEHVQLAIDNLQLLVRKQKDEARRTNVAPVRKVLNSANPRQKNDLSAYERACRYVDRISPGIQGQRGSDLMIWAASCLTQGFCLSRDDAFAILKARYGPRCSPPWEDDREIWHKVDQSIEHPLDKPRGWLLEVEHRISPPAWEVAVINSAAGSDGAAESDTPGFAEDECPLLSDIGNARRFVAQHGSDLRYCHAWKGWLVWDGSRWKRDESGHVVELAKKSVLKLYREAQEQIDQMAAEPQNGNELLQSVRRLLGWGLKSQSIQRIKAMLELAQSESGIPVSPDLLDADPWSLNVLNGTVDLQTGRLRLARREDLITKIAPVTFDEHASCPVWERFVHEIFLSREPLLRYVQRLAGYSATGRTTEHVLPIPHGCGQNGKTTLMNVLLDVLGGEYSGKAPRDLLLKNKTDKHPTSLAWLHGRRLVVCTETNDGDRLDEGLVKDLTGGEQVTGRGMFENNRSFISTHKIWLVTNHTPKITGTDPAIWRRPKLIQFEYVVPEGKKDPLLPDKLRAEHSGILNWIIAGCMEWQRTGLNDPPEVLAATEEYRRTENTMEGWFAECCERRSSPDVRAGVTSLFKHYRSWCEANGVRPASAKEFGTQLRNWGIAKDAGKRWYEGVQLKVPKDFEASGSPTCRHVSAEDVW